MATHALASKIKDDQIEDGCTVRDIYRRGWNGLKGPEDVDAALGELVQCGWVRLERVKTGGRASTAVRINPRLA